MQAQQFHDQMATGIFKPIYPVIAHAILQKSQIRKGHCVDIGGGSGVLAVALACQSQLRVTVIDCDRKCIDLAANYFFENKMADRLNAVHGYAEEIPFPDNSIDLVVSRGSVFFWNDKEKGMNEIFRILRPNGFACIGGGMGSTRLKRQIMNSQSADSKWLAENKKRFRKNLPIHLELMMRRTRVPFWTMESSDEGTWILFKKQH